MIQGALNTELPLNTLSPQYHSRSQIARILTESWFAQEMYCPSCLQALQILKANTKVKDFTCLCCSNSFQLKAQAKSFTTRVLDGAYTPMMEAISLNLTPSFSFLHYSTDSYKVQRLFLVPKSFITKSVIESRPPLSTKARRAGWQGCNIMLQNIPKSAKIDVILDEKPIPKKSVNKQWKLLSFMNEKNAKERTWIADVLACVQKIDSQTFTLKDVYNFESDLAVLHPNNSHIKPKIRQQLQVLRDKGLISFEKRGNYSIKKIDG